MAKESYTITDMLQILRGRMKEGTGQIVITKQEKGRYEFATLSNGKKIKNTPKV